MTAETLRDPLVEVVGLDPTEAVDLMVRSDTTATRSSEVEAYLADHPPAEAAQ